jgi:hypothetical protein
MARYTWGPFRFYGGYIYARLMNPSDDYPNGFPTIAEGIFVPPGAETSNAYDVNRIFNTVWTGARYSVWSNLDLAAGVYYRTQNDYLPPPGVCTGTGTSVSSSKCAGSTGAVSFLIDCKPIKRVDVSGGVMGVQRVGRVRERPPLHAKHRPDGRPAHPLLKIFATVERASGVERG